MEEQFVFKHVRKNNSYLKSDEYANDTEIVITLNGEQNLTQVFEAFKGYLQAVGFCLKMDDRIDIVNDIVNDEVPSSADDVWDDEDEDEDEDKSEESWEGPGHQEFSLVRNGGYNTELQERKYDDTTSGKDLDESFVEPYIDTKLLELEAAIIPFLENLKKDPEKTMLRWPNRADVIDQQIEKIKKIIGE